MSDPAVPTFYIGQGLITAVVPQLSTDQALTVSNIGGFAQAADDARAVIEFMHSWGVPEIYQTPLSCTASATTQYDVSISSVSGLEVPVRMVARTEGREFTLTVPTPDLTQRRVWPSSRRLTQWEPRSRRSRGPSPARFSRGRVQSWTEGFSINVATTITWTATATAAFDVNPGNNRVTATTRVTGKGGGRQ